MGQHKQLVVHALHKGKRSKRWLCSLRPRSAGTRYPGGLPCNQPTAQRQQGCRWGTHRDCLGAQHGPKSVQEGPSSEQRAALVESG